MSRIVFVSQPAFGHVNPTLPIVAELVRRGEQVIYYDDAEFQTKIAATGAEFRPWPANTLTSTDIAEATQRGDGVPVVHAIINATDTLLPFMLDELRREPPDVVAFDSNALWARMAANILRLPAISLMTTILPDITKAHLALSEWAHMLGPVLPDIPKVYLGTRRLIRQYGQDAFPPRPIFPMRGDLNIVFTLRDLQPENKAVNETFRFVGPLMNPQASDEFLFDLPTDKPLVYISLGTLHRGSVDFFRQCFEAFGPLPAQFILSVGRQTDIATLGLIPPNFVVRPFVPQLEVLHRAAVFVTHGGMNSVLEGLYYGVPMVLIPQQFEQLLIAQYVEKRGAGVVLRGALSGKPIMAAELRPALERVLNQPSFRAAAGTLQTAARHAGGARQAADEIQAFAEAHVSKTIKAGVES